MFKQLNIFIGLVVFLIYSNKSFSQSYSKTYTIKQTGGTVSFKIVPTSADITDGGNQNSKVIRYNVNYSIVVTYKNVPSGATLRNTVIKFENSSSTASEGTSYVSPHTFSSTDQQYADNLSTSTNPGLTGYTIDDLTDKNRSKNSQVLTIANYRTVNLKFVLQSAAGPEYDFANYDKNNGDTLGAVATYSLPIRLLSFDITQNNSSNILNWKTSAEINNNYFVIEKSNDGNVFDSIATVKGAGNSTQILNYSYTDNQPLSGTNYYRLRQVDYDGNYSYSSIATIYFSGTVTGSSDINVFPNPGNGAINIKGEWSNYNTVRVTSMLGQIVYSGNIHSNNLQLPSNLAKGMYFINFYRNNQPSKALKYMLR